MFLFQFPKILFTPPLQQIMDTTLSENWHALSAACFRNLGSLHRCHWPLMEHWEEYAVPNRSRFPAIDEKDYLSGTPVIAAMDKVECQYLRTEFRRDARHFFEEFVNCLLSLVASRSVIGQGMRCFCPASVVGRDDVAPFQLFNMLLDGF